MTMGLDVTPGGASSDAYETLANWKTWADARGYDYSDFDDTEIEQASRRGATGLDRLYRGRWPGLRVNARNQSRDWPRYGVLDNEGFAVDSATIPAEVVAGANEATWRELQSPDSLMPDIAAGGKVLKRVKADETEIEYAVNGQTRKTFDAIEAALAPLLGGVSSEYTATAVR
jgi:hypothetical protein